MNRKDEIVIFTDLDTLTEEEREALGKAPGPDEADFELEPDVPVIFADLWPTEGGRGHGAEE